MMKIVFRVDASLRIGTGHIMRCLTLARELERRGASCHFICREFPCNLLHLIESKGFALSALPYIQYKVAIEKKKYDDTTKHTSLLRCDWKVDAEQTISIITKLKPDWLVVDHYSLDKSWESKVNSYVDYLMVIDDLADRAHICDLLLDQNLGRSFSDYSNLIPEDSLSLLGPEYALLRPEFSELRNYSMQRRSAPQLNKILVSMGGVDNLNSSGQVLNILEVCNLPIDCQVSIILGRHSPWIGKVQEATERSKLNVRLFCDVTDMGQMLADCDISIGAAGITSWERACLGVPSLIVILAENQRVGAIVLGDSGAAKLIGEPKDIEVNLPLLISEVKDQKTMIMMSNLAANITDGFGAKRVADTMELVSSSE
ncbi:UDP-2,4-diacetamido-2,4,6-trideoxy-beta-L-altropyranose hydrolase [uncultured Microbulbifer sp.]|uniref:UDP-2,4-diacetamido-2,4, 6-trideoxy-beta-L-altropyranose hydrolase n=1 Tax=uncultured Microbulbifer sp. TaxID=348147 RepID=UPI0026248B5E|nr:UDP-2,4-diacetamido-2,4,6-trideoxy-beta-L-altropyranose hydrolase [uncultured Microbulbifer sp.]